MLPKHSTILFLKTRQVTCGQVIYTDKWFQIKTDNERSGLEDRLRVTLPVYESQAHHLELCDLEHVIHFSVPRFPHL